MGYSIGSAVARAYRDDGSPFGGNTAASVYSRPPSFNSEGTPTTTLAVKKATVTVGPQQASASDPNQPKKQRIILTPIKPNGEFPAPPSVQNSPAPAIEIPAASTIKLGPTRPTTVNPSGTENNAPATFSDPKPAPNTGNVNNSAPLAPLDQVDSATSDK